MYMKDILIKETADLKKLTEMGFLYSAIEGGYVSKNGATIVSVKRRPYERHVMQYERESNC